MRLIDTIHRLIEEAGSYATHRRYAKASDAFTVAADAAAEFGSGLWARDLRNEARRYAVAAWVRDVASKDVERLALLDANDVYPYTFTEAGRRPVVLDADYTVHGAPGEIYRWRFHFPGTDTDAHVRITRRGRIEWDREIHTLAPRTPRARRRR